MPKPISDNEIRYTIKLNKRDITAQKKNAEDEWPLNGFILIIKNIINTKEDILRFNIKSNSGINPNKKNISIETKPPNIRNE